MRSVPPTATQRVFRNEIVALLRKHASEIDGDGKLDGVEMVAVTAHLLGQLIAMQDQRKYKSADIMELVAANIETGNAEVINGLATSTAGNA